VSRRSSCRGDIDMSKISARIERPIAGVLGFSFLKDRIIQIDYGNLKLRSLPSPSYPRIQLAPNTVNTIAMNFRREEGRRDRRFSVREQRKDARYARYRLERQFLAHSLKRSLCSIWKMTPLKAKLKLPLGTTVSTSGKNGILKSIRMGRYSADGVQASFFPPKTGHDNQPWQVNIGNAFFQDFVMTFDFKNKIVGVRES
jgi:hypothetical protein